MAEYKDYYEILGITDEEKNLSASEFEKILKKKYRANALKFHPDRWANGTEEEKKEAEQKFKEIAEANEVLSDPKKRQMYDNGGFEFDSSGFDPFEMFRNMSGGGFDSMFGNMFGNMNGGRRVSKGTNIQTNISLTMEEAYIGGEKTITVTRQKPCVHCKGTGSEDGKESSCSWVWQFSLQHWQPDALVMTMKHTSMMSTDTQKPAYTIMAITKRLKAIRV